MKKVFLFACLMVPTLLLAGVRTIDDAAQIAAQFVNGNAIMSAAQNAPRRADEMQCVHLCSKLESQMPAFYVFNVQQGGFVIVSGDDLAEDVLVYSEVGSFDAQHINPNFQFWLNRLQEELSIINEDNAAAKVTQAVEPIAPLLVNNEGQEIAWDQRSPYYNQCPMDLWKKTERCLTGCVATATAQVMYKWRHPIKGTGSHSYTWECCMDEDCESVSGKELSLDFSSITFDWDNMLPTYYAKSASSAQKNAVAMLMYSCGVACDMQYGGETIGGSGAWTDDMGAALVKYFGYKVDKMISTYSKSIYRFAKGTSIPTEIDYEWKVPMDKFAEYFYTELEAGRPIIMGGEGNDDVGAHEFVCDGRDSSGKFHINWGWSGEGNCYCVLTALQPAKMQYVFSNEIDALLGVEPNPTSPIEQLRLEKPNYNKRLLNGQIVIECNGMIYNVLGCTIAQ